MNTPTSVNGNERFDTVVIGGGQAGLSAGYHLTRLGVDTVILDAGERVGDPWRRRWDSLRLFTPASFDGLDGMPFPAPPHYFPTKEEMADYLEAYADRFGLPVRTRSRVRRLHRNGGEFAVETSDGRTYLAHNVVVAMSDMQEPRTPSFAADLRPEIRQLHSCEYRDPSQLDAGDVLIVGAGNSGADIAMEVAQHHRTWMSGRDTGHLPFRIETAVGRLMVPLVLRLLFHRVLTVRTPMGRRARPKVIAKGGPLIRVKPADLIGAGVERVPRTTGTSDGRPLLADGRVLDVTSVIWCTGYRAGFSWIDLPVLGDDAPRHSAGIAPDCPGLYFVGLEFLYSLSSVMIHGVGRDARRIAEHIHARRRPARPTLAAARA
jgi:putative flavoprotein involved in K+ transport